MLAEMHLLSAFLGCNSAPKQYPKTKLSVLLWYGSPESFRNNTKNIHNTALEISGVDYDIDSYK